VRKPQATIQRVTREAGLAGSASAAGETQTGQGHDRNGDAAAPPHDAPASAKYPLEGDLYPYSGPSMVVCMITARQIRAARALLSWSQQQLADKAIVSLNAVARLEKGLVDPRVSTVVAIEKALTKAGVEFLAADQKGEGVRLKSPRA
jgi:DNA-binding XRE family transcriptional regulator